MMTNNDSSWYLLIVFLKLDKIKVIQKLSQLCFLISRIVYLFYGSVFKIFLTKSFASFVMYLGNLKSPDIIFLYNYVVLVSSKGR